MGLYILVYVLLSILMGVIGRRKAIGFVGFFVLSLVVTPLLTALVLLMTSTRPDQVTDQQ